MSKSYIVDDDYNDSRLDKWFKNEIINLPHSLLEKILRQNKVRVNKKKTKSSYRLPTGDLIEIYNISKLKPVDKNEKIKYIPKKNDIGIKNIELKILFCNSFSIIFCQNFF